MPRLPRLLAVAALLAGAAPVPAQPTPSDFGHYHPADRYPGIATSSFYLPMRDGTRLAVQVSRPAEGGKPVEGRFPVIWEAGISLPPVPTDTPADAAFQGFVDWSRLVHAGYVIVTVARRGNGQSMGSVRGYHDREEAYDAYEITEWLARQPWSDGKIGMHGCSNTGEAVMHALTVAPPHLKAAWAGCFSWSKYDGFLRGGGIVANWGSGPQRTIAEDMAQRPVDGDADKTLLREAAEDHQRNSNLRELLRSVPYRDSWSPLTRSRFAVEDSAGTYLDQIRRAAIPLTIQGGWYDDFRGQAFIALANLPGTRLLMGPWQHCRQDGFDIVAEAQRFFDYHLKGIDTGIAREDPIHYLVVGAEPGAQWRSAASWPIPEAHPRLLHLAAGQLSDRVRSARPATFTVDTDPHCPDTSNVTTLNKAAPFYQPCHPLKGAASFASAPLAAAGTVVGHPVASLWITADAPDANLFAYLEDVAPDGHVTVITEGRLKASLRKPGTAPWAMMGLPWHRGYAADAQPLEPGNPAELTFDLLPAAHRLEAGHRLQLSISGSDWRESDRHPPATPVHVSILSDRAHASSVSVPIVGG
jgi:putative CocE/NonD family hydrolase